MIATQFNDADNTYSAATALGLIVYGASREYAAKAIAAAIPGFTDYQIEHALSYPSTPSEWRATLASAMANQITDIESQISEVSDAVADDVSNVVDRVTNLTELVDRVKEDAERERHRKALEAELSRLDREVTARLPAMRIAAPSYQEWELLNLIYRTMPRRAEVISELEELNANSS